MTTVLEGYTERWRIEELHRQIKQDFHFAQIAVRDYPSLKALGVLVMLIELREFAPPRSSCDFLRRWSLSFWPSPVSCRESGCLTSLPTRFTWSVRP